MATKTMRGACSACFREMDTGGGMMHKHGWRESGGRRAGEYGRVWHSGSCFGVYHKPFEVSPEGTWAFLKEVLFPYALDVQARLNHLETRPPLSADYTYRDEWDAKTRIWPTEERAVTLKDGETRTVSTGPRPSDTTTLSYEWVWKSVHRGVKRELKAVKEDGAEIYAKADTWKAGKLRSKKAKGPCVHKANPRAGRGYVVNGGAALCGSRSDFVKTSKANDEVTCSRCRKYLDKDAAVRRGRDGEKADAVTLTAWLDENGGLVTSKEIKKALGWDTKRFNRAEGRADKVHSDWSSPTKYMGRAAWEDWRVREQA